jgi:pyridoxamine 5'-phosphate oxidase
MAADPLDFDNPPTDPVAQARLWFEDAEATGLPNPNAFTLATIDADGKPSARIVLCKGFDERGVVFFTNYQSRKGEALFGDPRAAALFHWDTLSRQLRIEGRVSMVSEGESDAYFATRPRPSQLGAWASAQSRPLADRATLEEQVSKAEQRFAGRDVPRPPHWGGFRLSLDSIEFWQGDPNRVHDRIVYSPSPRSRGSWSTQRLFP